MQAARHDGHCAISGIAAHPCEERKDGAPTFRYGKGRTGRGEGWATRQWEYFDRMVVFSESEEGMVSGLDSWINGAGADGWELVSSIPLIAPNKDGVAYGTIGIHMVFKRPHEAPAEA